MKQVAIASALTWDGARVPLHTLPPQAQAFLRVKKAILPSPKKMSELFSENAVEEIRVCWVPRLQGGSPLNEPFVSLNGQRLSFRITASKRFGEILGVIYRR